MLMGRNPHAGGCTLPSLYCWRNRAPHTWAAVLACWGLCGLSLWKRAPASDQYIGWHLLVLLPVSSPILREFSRSKCCSCHPAFLLVAHPGLWNGRLKISPCNQPIWHQYKDFLHHSMRVVSCCGFSVFTQVFCITHFLPVVGGWQEEQAPVLWHNCSYVVGNVGVQALISRAVS